MFVLSKKKISEVQQEKLKTNSLNNLSTKSKIHNYFDPILQIII